MKTKNPPRRRTLLLAPALLLAWAAAALAAGDETQQARAVVEDTVAEVLAVLREADLSTQERQDRIEAIALERFDFDTISRLVLARNWRRFTPEQREEFEAEFKTYLSESYGGRIERYEQESVEFLGERLEPRGDVTVRTRIVGGQADGVVVDYRLRERGGRWLVIDAVLEGVSLVSSFRSQFQEVISQSGPEGLLEKLREKNLAPPPELSSKTAAAS
jgi:phospholipid transport system substrate-binding protein